ncbi:uncharacterized protein F5147DRAFT_20263 [Suillus discolor]|uniref:Uncharacterized protein n=1 Tax=Suillus discolor TaxID=1912936 RepID=A0A9P7JWZ4_9AGAM|nr:uncharacterized protein F5147DRAFT_20263 [Suillus discolor]KAG2114250.1 hypothetical protein F5147DRAFT_20263 [Suillus discolor]
MESENEIMVDLEHQVPENSYYELMEPESNFDEALARSELQRQTEELFSYIDLDPPEPNFADQITSLIAHDDCNTARDPHVPAPDMPTSTTLPSSEKASGTSSNDAVPVEIIPHRIVVDTISHVESSPSSKIPMVAAEAPSQTHATVPTIAKPSIMWNYTPPTTNPFFARALAFNAKALKKPLPLVAQVSNEPNATASPAAPAASPAIVGSSIAKILPEPLLVEQASDAPTARNNPASSPSLDHLLPCDSDRNVVSPTVDEATVEAPQQLPQIDSRDDIRASSTRSDQPSTRESTAMTVPISISDIPPPAIALPSSTPLPVPPRVQRPIKGLSLTELINKRREEHFRLHPSGEYIDLTNDVSPSRDGSQAPGVSKPQESVQSLHTISQNPSSLPAPVSASQPAPTLETRTPSIQEIRDLMRQRPLSSKLSMSSAASNPSTSSVASAASALVPNISPPHSITSNSTSSSNQSGSKSSSRKKTRSMGMASLEMFISPIPNWSQSASTKKTTTPTVKRTSCNADIFRRIITPTAEISMRSPSLSPSEGRRTRRVVRPSSPLGVGAGDVAVQLDDQSHELPEPLDGPIVTPFAIPAEGEMEVQNTSAHQDVPLDDVMDDMIPSEGLQGVTESIGSLDLHEHGRSPEVDINVNQSIRL